MASKRDHPLYSPPNHVQVLGEGNAPCRFEAFHEMLIPRGLEGSLVTIIVYFAEYSCLVVSPMRL